MNRQVAGWITHRWTKWVVLVVMLLFVGALGSFGGKLTSVQDNDVAAWLPDDAESTQVIEKAGSFYDEESVPAIVMLSSSGRLTPQELAAAQTVARDLAALEDVPIGKISPPSPAVTARRSSWSSR